VPIVILSWYQAWGSAYAPCRPDLIQKVQRRHLIPMITWEPWQLPNSLPTPCKPAAQPAFALERLLQGVYERYIQSWASDLAKCRGAVWLRPMHEMNGDWYPWGGMVNGNNPKLFREAWHYLRGIFKAAGAANVVWVWCPYVLSVPATADNSLEHYFPGTGQVDWLGLDGYNWGTTQPWSRWESFADIFTDAYARLTALAPDKPMLIAELGCAEEGGNKAQWLRDAFQQIISQFEKIKAVVWFQIAKECDWRLDSSPEAIQAFHEQKGLFQARKVWGARWGAPGMTGMGG